MDKAGAENVAAYKANTDMQQELEDAVAMFQHSTMVVDRLSPALEFVVLQTGAKMYGMKLATDNMFYSLINEWILRLPPAREPSHRLHTCTTLRRSASP